MELTQQITELRRTGQTLVAELECDIEAGIPEPIGLPPFKTALETSAPKPEKANE